MEHRGSVNKIMCNLTLITAVSVVNKQFCHGNYTACVYISKN